MTSLDHQDRRAITAVSHTDPSPEPESFWPVYATLVVQHPALSPNGDLLAFVVLQDDPATGRSSTELRVRSAASDTAPNLSDAADQPARTEVRLGVDAEDGSYVDKISHPHWLDDDNLAYVVESTHGGHRIRQIALGGATTDVEFNAVGALLMRWHPTERALVVATQLPASEDEPPFPSRYGLFRYELDGSQPTPLHSSPEPYLDLAWSPDGQYLAAVVPFGPHASVTDVTAALLISATKTSAPRVVGPKTGHVHSVAFTGYSSHVVVVGRHDTDLGNMSGYAYPVHVAPEAGSGGSPIGPGLDDLNLDFCRPFDGASGSVVVVARRFGHRVPIPAAVLDGPHPDSAPPRERTAASLSQVDLVEMATFPRGGQFAAVVRTHEFATSLALVDAATGAIRVLPRDNAGGPTPTAPERVVTPTTWPTTTGDIHGWTVTRGGAAGPRRTLVDLHHGPHTAWTGAVEPSHLHHETLLDRGWAIVLPNTSGSDGYGERLLRDVRGRWGEPDTTQVLALVEHLINTEVTAPGLVALAGYSYGAFLTANILTRTDRFAAAVCAAGIYDLDQHVRTSDYGNLVVHLEMGGLTPEQDPDLYRRLSPLHRADQVTTPTLVIHPADDTNVWPAQAEAWARALHDSGSAETNLILIPGADHEFPWDGTWAARDQYYSAVVTWLERTVTAPLPAQTPDPSRSSATGAHS